VTHYYEHAGACVVKLDAGPLRVGRHDPRARAHDRLLPARRPLERDHVAIDAARVGEEVGVQVSQRVRAHDSVFKLSGR
jgi:hypothetical protein